MSLMLLLPALSAHAAETEAEAMERDNTPLPRYTDARAVHAAFVAQEAAFQDCMDEHANARDLELRVSFVVSTAGVFTDAAIGDHEADLEPLVACLITAVGHGSVAAHDEPGIPASTVILVVDGRYEPYPVVTLDERQAHPRFYYLPGPAGEALQRVVGDGAPNEGEHGVDSETDAPWTSTDD